MKSALLVAALVAIAIAPCMAQQGGLHEVELRTFYAEFLAAVHASDKEKLAGLIAFPVDDWSVEDKGDIQTGTIKDRDDFLARYKQLFSPSIRSHVPKAKLQTLNNGAGLLIWDDADTESAFEFDYVEGTGYRVSSFTIGPR